MNHVIYMPARRCGTWAFNRLQSHLHAVAHASTRGIDLDLQDLDRIERSIRRMTPVFNRPGQSQYFITTRYKGQRFAVLFDAQLEHIISVGLARSLVSHAHWIVADEWSNGSER
ncbi:MAG: hypothetical protein HQL35_04850 [Alphaproteobacteria bacterium]|nr:hypothetical protein [Alphaproteobacteria bacterium]